MNLFLGRHLFPPHQFRALHYLYVLVPAVYKRGVAWKYLRVRLHRCDSHDFLPCSVVGDELEFLRFTVKYYIIKLIAL